jgi:hypothetical protein
MVHVQRVAGLGPVDGDADDVVVTGFVVDGHEVLAVLVGSGGGGQW